MADISRKTITVLRFLWENTDENNQATTADIIDGVGKLGVSIDRHTIKPIVNQLTELGIDVIENSGSPNKYYIGTRVFELPEMKMLIDAVEAAKFISASRSKELVSKITSLAGPTEAKELKRHLYIDGRAKSESKNLLLTVDTLHIAINEKRRVNFMYYDYNVEKKRVHKHRGYVYQLSPYALVWQDDFYYVLGFSERHQKMTKFRVDRIDKIELATTRSRKKPDNFEPVAFLKSIFSMYDGELQQIRLRCDSDMMKVIIDRFGKDVKTNSAGDNGFYADVEVSVSRTFFGWLFGFAGKIDIVSPKQVRDDYLSLAKTVVAKFEE